MSRLLLLFALLLKLFSLQAQVLVHEEPVHRPVFQNDKLRILNVLLPPGDTTQYHIHHTPSLFLFFTSTSTSSQLQGAAPTSGRSQAGTFLFENLAAPHQRTHRVWNTDRDTFHVMDIELLSSDSGFIQRPLMLPHLQAVIDTSWARVYRITLNAGERFSLQNDKRSFVLVSMTTVPVEEKQGEKTVLKNLQPGSFIQTKSGKQISIKNVGNNMSQFALLELPRS